MTPETSRAVYTLPDDFMMRIVVQGTPAPQGSKKFVGVHNGRGVMVESSKKVKPWRQDVKAEVERLLANYKHLHGVDWIPLDRALRVTMVFTLPKPISLPKRRTRPDRKPDLSKLARSTEDALTDAGLWRDDARVVEYARLAKVYPGDGPWALASPGCIIMLSYAAAAAECAA